MGRILFWLAAITLRGSSFYVAGLVVRASEQVRNSTAVHDESRKQSSKHASEKSNNEDGEDLRPCLDDKRIVFIGPSTSRSDYLALAFFAEYGRWPDTDVISYGPATGIP